MTDPIAIPEMWVPLIAALIPLIAAFAVKPAGSNLARAAVALIAAGVLAAVEALVDGDPDTTASILSVFGTAVITALTAYHAFWAHLRINSKAGTQGVGTSAPEGD